MKTGRLALFILIVVTFGMVSCTSASNTQVQVTPNTVSIPTEVSSLTPTDEPIAANTIAPTETPIPTKTPTPTETQIPSPTSDGRVWNEAQFENFMRFGGHHMIFAADNWVLEDGYVYIIGKGWDYSTQYPSIPPFDWAALQSREKDAKGNLQSFNYLAEWDKLVIDAKIPPNVLCMWIWEGFQNGHGWPGLPRSETYDALSKGFGNPNKEPYCKEFNTNLQS